MLVTACPSGAMANVYTLVGRMNVALSVTLTAVSCLAAVLTTPLALAVLQPTRRSQPASPLRSVC
jgi:BASS family bile acid:Na+ symporter